MTTNPSDANLRMATHPDLVELRARYDRAAMSRTAEIVTGLALLSGLYLAISPWVIGFNTTSLLTVNNVIAGLTLVVLAFSYAWAFDRTHTLAWCAPVLGVWTIVAPWVIYRMGLPPHLWISNVCVGAVATVVGLGVTALTMTRAIRR